MKNVRKRIEPPTKWMPVGSFELVCHLDDSREVLKTIKDAGVKPIYGVDDSALTKWFGFASEGELDRAYAALVPARPAYGKKEDQADNYVEAE